MMTNAVQLFKCLADATRLEIVCALSDGPKYVELLSQRLDRTPSTISFHLKKLEEAGLLSDRNLPGQVHFEMSLPERVSLAKKLFSS